MGIAWQILKRDLLTLLFPRNEKTGKRGFSLMFGWILTAALLAGSFYAGLKLFQYVYRNFADYPQIRDGIAVNLLNATSLTAFLMILLTGFQWSYRTIYESDDIAFLLSMPIRASSVFLAKFFTNYAGISLFALVFSLPFWIAYGMVEGAGGAFYFLTVFGFFFFVLFANSLISFILLLAMRFIPGRRLKQVFVAVTAIIGVTIVLISQMVAAKAPDDPVALLQKLGQYDSLGSPYLLTTWLTDTVLSSIPRLGISGLLSGILLFGGGLLATFAVVRLSEVWYLEGWAGENEQEPVNRRRKARKLEEANGLWSRLNGTFWGVLKKDAKLLLREPLLWYNMAVSVIVLGFLIYNLSTRATPPTNPEESYAASVSVITMAAFISGVTGSQIGGLSISREGQSFWVIRANTADLKGFFWAKVLYAVAPSALVMVLTSVAVEFTALPHYPLWRNLVVGLSLVSVLSIFQLLLDVYFPDFTVKLELGSNTKNQRGSGKVLTSMFASMALSILLGAIVFSPAFLTKIRWFQGVETDALLWISQTIIFLLAVVVTCVSYIISKKRLREMFFDR